MSGLLPPPLPDAVAEPGPPARTRRTKRDELVTGCVIAAALALATIASARIVADDLREGPLWAVAGALRGINLAAAIACILLSVAASVAVVRKMSGFDTWSKGFVAAAVTAICMLPALLTVEESLDESVLFVTPAVMVVPAVLAAAVTVIAARWRRARMWLLLAAAAVAAWPIATAAAYVDNTDHPVPAALAAAVFLLPLVLSVTARIATGVVDQLIRAIVAAAHAVGLVFVISAATSCVDDDCIPVPLWYLCGALAIVWVATSDLLPRRPNREPADPGAEPEPAASRHPLVAAGGWAFAAPFGFLAIAALIAVPVDPNRSSPSFDMAEPETIKQLPAMLAWDNREGCVNIAGVGDLTVFRQTCRAEFVEWIEPNPLLVISDPRRNRSVFDPITFDLSPLSWDFVPNVAEPSIALRLETLDRGRVEAWVDETDGSSRRLIEAQGGYTYALLDGGISADGTLAAVVDNAGRILLVPTDGSDDAVVLDSNVRRFGGWEPAFGPAVTEFALERKVPLRIPPGVEDERDFSDAHRELEAVLDLTVSADLVVVGDEVHVRLTGTPSAADFPLGYCVAVTSFFESASADRTYRSVDIGGPVPFCDASTEQLDADCAAPTVPTAATVDDLERFEVLVIEAELIAPRSDDLVPGEFAYYQLTTRQVTGGAINPDRLPLLDDTCS